MVYNDAAMQECYKKRGFVEDQSSLWFDAISRDFTVNSLYYNLQTGEIEDPIGMGMPDIKEGVVCTSHPYRTNQNFEDHEVRILRALRFTEKLNFKLCDSVFLHIAHNENFNKSF